MKKLLLAALIMTGISASAQQIGTATVYAPTLMYTPGIFGSVYTIDGVYATPFMIQSELRKDPVAYNLWNKGNGNIVGGSVLLYPSAFVFGWGLGSLGWDDAAGVYIGVGGAGMAAGYYLLAKGWDQKSQALFTFNKNRGNEVSFDLHPLFNENGGGLAIKF